MDMLIATTTDMDHLDQLEPNSFEEVLEEQYANTFCRSLRSRLNGQGVLLFHLDKKGILSQNVEPTSRMVVPHIVNSGVLHLRTTRRYLGI